MNPANFVRDCQRQNYHPTYAIGGVANQASIDNAQGENLLLIRISYRIRANNAIGNLVYPFYIREAA